MKRKSLVAMLVVFAMSVSLLAGCGSKTEKPAETTKKTEESKEDAKAAEPTEITVVTSYGGDDGNRQNYENAVASYQEATGNTVMDASATSNEEWKAKVLTDFETGTEPDVLFFFTNADAEPFIEAGKVVDIATIRETYPEYADNMKDSMMAAAADGKNYAVPSSGFWENMFVNKKVLADCNIEVPGPDYTWDQFLADCQTIKDKGYTPIAVSLFEVPHYWFEFVLMNNGTMANQLEVPAVDADGKLVEDAVSEKWVNGLNDMKDLYEKGFFPENTLTAKDADTVQLFAEGEAAFLIDGSWKVGHFVDNYADQLEDYAISYVPAKGERKATEALGGISMGYFITKKAWDDPAKQAAAVAFVEHMTSDEIMSTFVTTEVTALKNGASPEGLNSLQQSAADANNNITGITGAVQDTITSECKTDLFANIQHVVTGEMTAEEAIASAIALN
ncbi:ABC transporter substrate-binding protein [Frisingicoccus sp.]|uniref:ABC transporter substrate-binding protein n=1 Tax=Frisingicoccus sp. TaxID=1918627 RepID=UPI0015B9BD83|nr:extracellular solute-binding protein [Frisingicoccus sp.]MEE0752881.1 extracellular solute-binding protein [Frisingicoccus sp.]